MLDFRGLIENALRALDEERPADAEKGIRSALAISPRDDQLLHLLGVSLIRQQRETEAIEPLKKAISLNRRNAEYHNALGCALRNLGQVAEGMESLQRALKLEPGLVDAHFNLAQAYQRLGNFDKAEEKFRWLLARNPRDVETMGALSTLRWFIGDHEDVYRGPRGCRRCLAQRYCRSSRDWRHEVSVVRAAARARPLRGRVATLPLAGQPACFPPSVRCGR
jgi:protein O-GlcNAc transferase